MRIRGLVIHKCVHSDFYNSNVYFDVELGFQLCKLELLSKWFRNIDIYIYVEIWKLYFTYKFLLLRTDLLSIVVFYFKLSKIKEHSNLLEVNEISVYVIL